MPKKPNPDSNSESLISSKMFGAMLLLILAIILVVFYPSKKVTDQNTRVSQAISTYEISKTEETKRRVMPAKASVKKPNEEEEGC